MAIEQRLNDRWIRDSEFLYRGSQVLLPKLADQPEITSRREAVLKRRPVASSTYEAARLSSKLESQVEWFAAEWISLFDAWHRQPSTHIFEDGYSVLYFLRVLTGNEQVLLRGHADARWEIETTSKRLRDFDAQQFEKARAAAEAFVAQVEALDFVREQYRTGLRPDQREALCQHYGFPTDYLDFTFSWDVALFFAEDWMKLPFELRPELGAIYAVPIHVMAREASLITLPAAIMRPSLQSGKFLKCDSPALLEKIREYQFRYRHAGTQYSDGMTQITYTTWPALFHFLFPSSDPIEAIAAGFRRQFKKD
jgi:hypothetical protein